MENFDHQKYRDNLAEKLVGTERKVARNRLIRVARGTSEYGQAFQMHAEDQIKEGTREDLSPERLGEYAELEKQIGNTPLVEQENALPNGNRLFVKQEFANGIGHSHYDRVYVKLFREKERLGLIKPGMHVFETTSGTAGVSFAAIGKALGYTCHVAIPEGGQQAREQAIKDAGASLYMTPKELYVNGFEKFIPAFQKEHPDYAFINHSMGNILGGGKNVNENAVATMHEIADEIAAQLPERGAQRADVVLSALGNGTNTLGLAERFKELAPDTKIIVYEPLAAGVGYSIKNGRRAFWNLLDSTDPSGEKGKSIAENRDFTLHDTPGMAFSGFESATVKKAIGLTDDVVLIASQKMEDDYERLSGKESLPPGVVKIDWSASDPSAASYGRSTLAGIAVAQSVAQAEQDKVFIVIGYDKADRYDLPPAEKV